MRNSTKNGNLSVQKMYNNITILQYYNMFKRSKIYYIAILSKYQRERNAKRKKRPYIVRVFITTSCPCVGSNSATNLRLE